MRFFICDAISFHHGRATAVRGKRKGKRKRYDAVMTIELSTLTRAVKDVAVSCWSHHVVESSFGR